MSTRLFYHDPFLKKYCDPLREQRATEYVDGLAGRENFTQLQVDDLVTTRTYVIAAMESQSAPDDLFSQKAKQYQDEHKRILTEARATSAAATGEAPLMFSVEIERA